MRTDQGGSAFSLYRSKLGFSNGGVARQLGAEEVEAGRAGLSGVMTAERVTVLAGGAVEEGIPVALVVALSAEIVAVRFWEGRTELVKRVPLLTT